MLEYNLGDVVDLIYGDDNIVRVTIISIYHDVKRIDDYEGHVNGYETQYIEFTGIDFSKISESASYVHSEYRAYEIYKWKLRDIIPKVIKTDNKWKMI
jgi:hypothetical protein